MDSGLWVCYKRSLNKFRGQGYINKGNTSCIDSWKFGMHLTSSKYFQS